MAEQILLQKPPAKKRKAESKSNSSNQKKLHQQSLHETVEGHRVTLVQQPPPITSESLISEFKRTYHLGGRKYLIFYGPKGIVQNIYLKDWDGVSVKASMSLNLSKFIMLLHSTDILTQNLTSISNGDDKIDTRIHIGELFYITCNSPYRVVQIRKWRKNRDDNLYPTTDGISLKPKEWQQFVNYCNEMYSERLELYQFIPCLLDPNKTNHNSLTCPECSVVSDDARGIVDVNIPL